MLVVAPGRRYLVLVYLVDFLNADCVETEQGTAGEAAEGVTPANRGHGWSAAATAWSDRWLLEERCLLRNRSVVSALSDRRPVLCLRAFTLDNLEAEACHLIR